MDPQELAATVIDLNDLNGVQEVTYTKVIDALPPGWKKRWEQECREAQINQLARWALTRAGGGTIALFQFEDKHYVAWLRGLATNVSGPHDTLRGAHTAAATIAGFLGL